MAILRNFLTLAYLFVFLFAGCGQEDASKNSPPAALDDKAFLPVPDLSIAVEKRIEGKTIEAIKLLREFNSEFPDSHSILLQLARALFESNQYELAAFRFDQAIAAGAENIAIREAADAYALAGDFNSASQRYADYLLINDDDKKTWVKYGRALAKINQPTKAINAFNRGSESLIYEDCMLIGDLLLSKQLLPQAEYWYRTAQSKNSQSSEPLLSLLKIKIESKQEEDAENLIFKAEEVSPGSIDKTVLAKPSANLLTTRNLGEFIRKGIAPTKLSVSELVAELKNKSASKIERVTLAGSKLPPMQQVDFNSSLKSNFEESEMSFSNETQTAMNLADAFSSPPAEEAILPEKPNIELARIAYLNRRYQAVLHSARIVLKENPKNAEAWKLCSQAHFQMGETQEAEMTILEAIRHDPKNFDIRMDYLRIARETLTSNRYLSELEKARELFPKSSDLVWELARRYHLVERMPVTAGVLYRKVLELEPEGSPLSRQAEMELLKLRD